MTDEISNLQKDVIDLKDQIHLLKLKDEDINEEIEKLIDENTDIWTNVMTIKKLLQQSLGKHDLAKKTQEESDRMSRIAEEKKEVRKMFKYD